MNEGGNGGETTSKLPPSNTQETIIGLMRSNPKITRREIAENIGLTVDGTSYHIRKMTEAGLIRYAGTSRKGNWEVLQDM